MPTSQKSTVEKYQNQTISSQPQESQIESVWLREPAENPQKTIEDYANNKLDETTTNMLNKTTEGISKYTPEWMKKIWEFFEKHFGFLGKIKEWFTDKIWEIKNWALAWIGWILGIDLLKMFNSEKNANTEKGSKKTESIAPIDSPLKEAERLLKNNHVMVAANSMIEFVKFTSGELDKDLEKNSELYALFKDFGGDIKTMISWPANIIAYFLKKGIKAEEIEKWWKKLKDSGETAFWTAVLATLGYKFVTGGKITKGGIVGFILYGLDKKLTKGKIGEAVIDGTFGVFQDFTEIEGKWINQFGWTHLKEVIQNKDQYDALEYLEKIFEAIKDDSIPAIFSLVWGTIHASLYIGGKWLIWEPAKAYTEAIWDLLNFKFEDAVETIIEGQVPIMVTAGALTLIKTRGNPWKALQNAWKISLPRLAFSHQGHIDVEMALRKLEGGYYKMTPAITETRAIAEAKYLAKKAAYYRQIDANEFHKIQTKLATIIETIKKTENWNIKSIPGIHWNEFKITRSTVHMTIAEDLIKDAEANWLHKTTLWEKTKNKFRVGPHNQEIKKWDILDYRTAKGTIIKTEVIAVWEKIILKPEKGSPFAVNKETVLSAKKHQPETFKTTSLELRAELERKIALHGEVLDSEHRKLIEVIAKWNKEEITKAKADFEAKKTSIKAEVSADFKKYGAEHLDAFKNKPIGHFGKLTMKGASLVYVGFEGARIVKMFAVGETKSGTAAAAELGLRLAPVSGTIMDTKDAWNFFKKGEIKQGAISTGFALIGWLSDALWITGVGGAVSRTAISSAKLGRMALKTTKTAEVIGKTEKAKDAIKGTTESIKATGKQVGDNVIEPITQTGQTVWKILTSKTALKLATPALALYLYENLKPTEEVIEDASNE